MFVQLKRFYASNYNLTTRPIEENVAARGMSTLLFGVAPGDPATFAAAVGLTLLTAIAGTVVPAWRAVRLTPMSVLRAE